MVATVQLMHEHPVGGAGLGSRPLEPTTPKMKPRELVKKSSSSFESRMPDRKELMNGVKEVLENKRKRRALEPQSSLTFISVMGDMGIFQFSCPIAPEFFYDCSERSKHEDHDALFDSLADEIDDVDLDSIHVNVMPEPHSDLVSCPRILTAHMMHQLMQEALPNSLKRTARWDRIYAIGRDGDTFYAMLNHCMGFKDTIIVAQTVQGFVLGGFASSPWRRTKQDAYFGTGESFLFASHPEQNEMQDTRMIQEETEGCVDEQDDQKPLSIFKWTGQNIYSQVCNVDDGTLAMGGDGAFGLIIQESFSRGSTGYCNTFGNPSLVPGGHFDITSFEVYGFTTMGATTQSSPSPSVDQSFS